MELSSVLQAALSPGPGRAAAEAALLQRLAKDPPGAVLAALLSALATGPSAAPQAQQLAAVLLKRALPELWPRLALEEQAAVRGRAVLALRGASDRAVLRLLAEAARAVAAAAGGPWPELSAWMREASEGGAPRGMAHAACIWVAAGLVEDFPSMAAEALAFFVQALASSDEDVVRSGLSALAELSRRVSGEEAAVHFYTGPVIAIARILERAPPAPVPVAEAALGALAQIAQCDETLLGDPREQQAPENLPPLVRLALSLAAERPELRPAALRLLGAIAESHGRLLVTRAAGRRLTASPLLYAVLALAAASVRAAGTAAGCAECALLGRAALGLPSRLLLPPVSKWAMRAFARSESGDWPPRAAALEALGAVGPGCLRQLRRQTVRVSKVLFAGLRDASPVVAAAAARAYRAASHVLEADAPVGSLRLRDALVPLLLSRLDGARGGDSGCAECAVESRLALREVLGRSRAKFRPPQIGQALLAWLLRELDSLPSGGEAAAVLLNCVERCARLQPVPAEQGPRIGRWLASASLEERTAALAALAAAAEAAPLGAAPAWLGEAMALASADLRAGPEQRRFDEAAPFRLLAACAGRLGSRPARLPDVFWAAAARLRGLAEGGAGGEAALAEALVGFSLLLAACAGDVASWPHDLQLTVAQLLAELLAWSCEGAGPSGPAAPGAAVRRAAAQCCGQWPSAPLGLALLRVLAARLLTEEDAEAASALCQSATTLLGQLRQPQQQRDQAAWQAEARQVLGSLGQALRAFAQGEAAVLAQALADGPDADASSSDSEDSSSSASSGSLGSFDAGSIWGGSTVASAGDLEVPTESSQSAGQAVEMAPGMRRCPPRLSAAVRALSAAFASAADSDPLTCAGAA